MDLITGTVCPILGVVLSTFQYSSFIKVMLEARRMKDLGPINPVPLVLTFLVCVIYVIYGVMLGNIYYVMSVAVGLPVSFFACTTSLSLLGHQNRPKGARKIEQLIIWSLVCLTSIGLLYSARVISFDMALEVIGRFALITSLVFYLSPLSRILIIIRKRDASSLIYSSIFSGLMARALWAAYGLAISDVNLYAPCFFGLFLSILELGMKIYFNMLSALAKTSSNQKPSPSVELVDNKGSVLGRDDQQIRSRKMSFDGGQPVQYAELSTHNDNYQLQAIEESLQFTGDLVHGSDPSAVTVGEQGPIMHALSGILAPFNPSLSMRTIVAEEESDPLLDVPQRDRAVTFVGLVSDVIASLPVLMETQQITGSNPIPASHTDDMSTRQRTKSNASFVDELPNVIKGISSYGFSSFVDDEKEAPALFDQDSSEKDQVGDEEAEPFFYGA